ncbi:MAG: hypothetical protein J2P25_01165 [Nocardiopsaceae bacterium]|nr:hypothetical protein [Nocardiopsaceae bacterium]
MLTALIAIVFAVAALTAIAAIIFAVVVIGIRNEPHAELRRDAPGPIAAISRRVLGVYVAATANDQPREIEGR